MARTDKQKADAVIIQRKLFTSYIARLQKEGKLTQEQDNAAMEICVTLDEVIEDYRAKALNG